MQAACAQFHVWQDEALSVASRAEKYSLKHTDQELVVSTRETGENAQSADNNTHMQGKVAARTDPVT
jgi:hypothetical protein